MYQAENVTFLTTAQTETAKGFSFPVIGGTGGYFTRSTGAETMLGALKQLILTNPGERVMMPNFGLGVRRYVFEPFTAVTETSLKKQIYDGIKEFLPDIVVNDVGISFNDHGGRNSLLISLNVALKEDLLNPRVLQLVV